MIINQSKETHLGRTVEPKYVIEPRPVIEKGRLYTFEVGGFGYGPWVLDGHDIWVRKDNPVMTVDWVGLFKALNTLIATQMPADRKVDHEIVLTRVFEGAEGWLPKKAEIRSMISAHAGILDRKVSDFYRDHYRESNGLVAPVELAELDGLIQETGDDSELNRDNVTRAAYYAVCSNDAPPRVQRRGITVLSRLLDPDFARRHLPADKLTEWDDDRRHTINWLRKFFEENDGDTHQMFLSFLEGGRHQ